MVQSRSSLVSSSAGGGGQLDTLTAGPPVASSTILLPEETATTGAQLAPDELEWTPEEEICLFKAMMETKPCGVNKHFHMVAIVEKLSNMLHKEISSTTIWNHLNTLYNMELLDELEGVRFPNEIREFSLPESDYGALKELKIHETIMPIEEPTEGRGSPKTTISRSTARSTVSKESTPKSVKKEQSEKSTAKASTPTPTATVETPVSTTKSNVKTDPRRDSKDSNASSKDSSSSKNASTPVSSKSSSNREAKAEKRSRSSVSGSEKSLIPEENIKTEDTGSAKKAPARRPLRSSLVPEEQPSPLSRRRRI